MRGLQSLLFKWSWLFFIGVILLSSCSLTHLDGESLELKDVPGRFSVEGAPLDLSRPWWLQFENSELNALITTAINQNLTVQEALARLHQARAAAVKAGAAKWPDLSGKMEFSRSRTGDSSGSNSDTDLWQLGVTASYEIDLWGRVEASHKQKQLLVDSSQEQVYTAIMTLSGQIAKTWIAIIGLQEHQKLLKEQLQLNTKLLELLQYRFSLARVSLLDVYQQQQTVLSIEKKRIPVEAQKKLLYHQLAVFTGQPPGSMGRIQTSKLPELHSVAQVGIPVDLLHWRPDLRASRQQLESAAWQVIQARAERFPRMDLSLSLSMSAAQIGDLIDNWILKLGSMLTGPLFDGGRSQAEIERTKAIVLEKLATHRLLLFTAIQEVEDSLVQEEQYHMSDASLTRQIALSDRTLQEATYQYLNGLNDFLPLLREQLQSLSLHLEQIQTRTEILNSRIDLYKALGGAWLPKVVPMASKPLLHKQ